MKIYVIILSLLFIMSAGCKSLKSDKKSTIILDERYVNMFTGKKYKLKEINVDDLKRIDSLLSNGIRSRDLQKLEINNLDNLKKKYYRQYLCYEDKEGDKIVYINGFCEVPSLFNEGIYRRLDWKKEMVDTSDGGNCYWSAEINLTKNVLTYVIVNTEG
ncbi:MAG: hypothetical protein LBI72_00600 [Flavobacteriaceae bacterium]|jgi:hypothetical protein|nr:hypothetical protein [Flavobacteriaceae bacterium]